MREMLVKPVKRGRGRPRKENSLSPVVKRAIVTPDKHFPLEDKPAIKALCKSIELVKANISIFPLALPLALISKVLLGAEVPIPILLLFPSTENKVVELP